jgi:TonB family protein
MGRALWAGQGGARGRKAINLVLIDPPQVYEVKFQDDHLAFKPLDNGGSGGRPEGQDLRRQRFGNPLELAATPLAEPPPMDLDASTLAMPGLILTDSAEGVARAGRGNGQGTGYGRGQGHDAQFLSSDHTDGPALALADMTVEHREIPNFPKLAKMAHLAGTVVVLVTVSETGTPQAMELVSSSSPVFTQEVQRVVPLWRFKPVMAEGRAARVRVRLVFIFTYDDGTLSG